MDYITAKEASEKWGVTVRRVQVLCSENKIQGAIRFGSNWAIPKSSKKPKDGRYRKGITKPTGLSENNKNK